MILGITGGTGCGKTTLLNVLKERGAVFRTATPSTTSC